MEELFVAEVDYEEAKKLADLTSIFQDLAFTIEALKRLWQLLKDGSQDDILIQSLWDAALINYVRCFSGGKRSGLSEDYFRDSKLEGDPIECHRYYKNLRDKHIAHSVNPFEQIKVSLILSKADSAKRKIEGVTTLSLKLRNSSIEGVETLLKLASIAQKEVARQAEKYRAKTLEVGKTLPLDTLYAKAETRLVAPASEDAGRARK